MNRTDKINSAPAEIVREYGPYPGKPNVHGVTFDGGRIWFASGDSIVALDPESGAMVRELAAAADAGTAFDGTYLYQIVEGRIDKINPVSGEILASIPAPGRGGDSGLTWAEGTLWVGEYRARKIHQIDPATGTILCSIESDRFVTGVTWDDGELWHGTWEGDESELRQVDTESGTIRQRLRMPTGVGVSGLESDGKGLFYCGGGPSGRIRAVRRPGREGA